MNNLFFNVSELSDDDLSEKLDKLSTKYYAASVMGMSFEIKVQLENMINLIQTELYNRSMIAAAKQWDSQFPDVIETDPVENVKPTENATKNDKKDKAEIDPSKVPQFKKIYRDN